MKRAGTPATFEACARKIRTFVRIEPSYEEKVAVLLRLDPAVAPCRHRVSENPQAAGIDTTANQMWQHFFVNCNDGADLSAPQG